MKFVLLLLISCLPIDQQNTTNKEIIYERNLPFIVNGVNYNGIANVKAERSYEIKAKFKNKFDLVRIRTCNRDETYKYRDAEFKYTWNPNELEREKNCYARIEIFNKDAEFFWGVISPSWNEKETLKATMNCNGGAFNATGAYMCQSLIGLNQRIIFWKPVDKFYVGDDCKKDPQIKAHSNKRTFDWVSPPWFCTIVFRQGEELFKLMSFGYDKTYIIGD